MSGGERHARGAGIAGARRQMSGAERHARGAGYAGARRLTCEPGTMSSAPSGQRTHAL